MMKTIYILTVYLFLSFFQLQAQHYNAADYWKMENDTTYTRLLDRLNSGQQLSSDETARLELFKAKLNDYFDKLPDNEKAVYYKNRAAWTANPASVNRPLRQEEIYAGERSMYSQYVVSSGIMGFFYGISADFLFEVNDAGVAVAVPLVTAGASVVIPLLTANDKNVNYNALALSLHGKVMGGLQGVALGVLITGKNESNWKVILGLSTLSSIGLGRLGFMLGRDKPWTEGRVALYSHYGALMPFEGLCIDGFFKADDPRIYGATSLVFGAGGYLIADAVARKTDYTRGDVNAISTLATLNGLTGLFVATDIAGNEAGNSALILIPAAAALGGSLVGQAWMKNAGLTSQQGRNLALATTGGALIGFGTAAIFKAEPSTPYYLAGYAGGMTVYALLAHKYLKSNRATLAIHEKHKTWNVNFMPQNILINKKLSGYVNSNPGRRITYLPAFSASFNF